MVDGILLYSIIVCGIYKHWLFSQAAQCSFPISRPSSTAIMGHLAWTAALTMVVLASSAGAWSPCAYNAKCQLYWRNYYKSYTIAEIAIARYGNTNYTLVNK